MTALICWSALAGARRDIAVALLSLSLAGCGSVSATKEPFASKAEIDAAKDRLIRCARVFIPQYDDGVSSAEAVARVVAGKCDEEFRATYRVNLQGWTDPVYIKGFSETYTLERVFTGLVLTDRKKRLERGRGGISAGKLPKTSSQ